MRRWLALALLGLLVACSPATPAPAPPATPAAPAAAPTAIRGTPPPSASVRITLPSLSVEYLHLAVTRSRGYFAEEGVEVGFDVSLPTVGIKALLAAQHEFAASAAAAQDAAAEGAPLKVVQVVQDRPTDGFFAWTQFPTIADLRGRRLGVTSFGTPPQILADRSFRKAGLSPDRDFTWVAIGTTDDLWTALKRGRVDASVLATNEVPLAARDGFVSLPVYDDPDLRYASVGLAALDRLIVERPDLVRRMIRALDKGTRFLKADRSVSVGVATQFLDVDRALAGDLYDLVADRYLPAGFISDADQAASLDVVRQSLALAAPVPIGAVFDFGLAREVDADLAAAGWQP